MTNADNHTGREPADKALTAAGDSGRSSDPITADHRARTMRATPSASAFTSDTEARAFRKLVSHLQERTDVQNIELMDLAGFCRNCLARWLREAAAEQGKPVDEAAARHQIYGMDYTEWKRRFQT